MDRPTTVLLHGFTGSSRSWGDSLVRGLRDAGIRTIAPDLPGHGARAGSGEGVGLGDALAVLDEATEGIDTYDLIGYSMGARIALHATLARSDRVRRLVLESGSPGLADADERATRRAADERLADRIVAIGVEAFVAEWAVLPLFASQHRLPPEVQARVETVRLGNTAAGLAGALRGLGTGAIPSLWDRLEELDCPTLLVSGGLDHKFVDIARRMALRLPEASSVLVPGVGHTVHLEAPDVWLETVTAFLCT